jgi:hypothetical protein
LFRLSDAAHLGVCRFEAQSSGNLKVLAPQTGLKPAPHVSRTFEKDLEKNALKAIRASLRRHLPDIVFD